MAKDQITEESPVEDKKSLAQAYYEGKADQSLKNLSTGGKEVEINLVNTRLVRFTKDFKYLKKGQVQSVSDAAYEIYDKEGVIEVIN